MSRLKKVWSEIKYWFFILLFLGLLFEMVASMMLYRKYTTGKLAILHFTKELFKNDDAHATSNFTYEPWMMFRIADYHSQRINVNGFERNSSPAQFINSSSKDTVDIYFFGGSSMFGVSLADAETIPSQFVKIVQKNNSVKSIRVRNFGVPHYYSKQELVLLSSLIFSGNKPDIAVFLDGMEDFYSGRMLYYDRPYYSYALQQAFDGKMFQKGGARFIDTTAQLSELPAGIDPSEYNDDLYSKFVANLKNLSMLCDRAGVKSYFFCQPVPFYKYSARDAALQGDFSRFNSIYPMLEKNADSIRNFFFLGNMLQNENAAAFANGLNYSPAFSEKIAAALYDTLKTDLQ
ncbi:MAG: hypothetical protein JNK79_04520 [Chitinophagaceae bacterium]|nr:hypothetical protein [Chitinophagaceae bacterium]